MSVRVSVRVADIANSKSNNKNNLKEIRPMMLVIVAKADVNLTTHLLLGVAIAGVQLRPSKTPKAIPHYKYERDLCKSTNEPKYKTKKKKCAMCEL